MIFIVDECRVVQIEQVMAVYLVITFIGILNLGGAHSYSLYTVTLTILHSAYVPFYFKHQLLSIKVKLLLEQQKQ